MKKRIARARGGRWRSGATLVEMLLTSSVLVLIGLVSINFNKVGTVSWDDCAADHRSELAAELGMQRLAPLIRAARSVTVASSSATVLTLQMPKYDSGNNVLVPLQNGDVDAFYLSDTTGSQQASGGILWRSVNGVPDRIWSLEGSRGRVTLASGGLNFTYNPTSAPESVTVSLQATATLENTTRTFSTRQEVVLRNKGL